jgi:hypothetical protein
LQRQETLNRHILCLFFLLLHNFPPSFGF